MTSLIKRFRDANEEKHTVGIFLVSIFLNI